MSGNPAKVQDYGTDKSAYILKHMLLSFPCNTGFRYYAFPIRTHKTITPDTEYEKLMTNLRQFDSDLLLSVNNIVNGYRLFIATA